MKKPEQFLDVSLLEISSDHTKVWRFALFDSELNLVSFKYHKTLESVVLFLGCEWIDKKPISIVFDKGTLNLVDGLNPLFEGVDILVEQNGNARSKGKPERVISKIEREFETVHKAHKWSGFIELNKLADNFREARL